MNAEIHTFELESLWTGNSDGDGVVRAGWGGEAEYGVPKYLGGKEGRSNPEEMLLSALVSCYSITLALLFERKRLAHMPIRVHAVGEIVRQADRTLKFTTIQLHPQITVGDADEAAKKTILELAFKAERYCIISNALRGNVTISIEPELIGVT